MSAQHSEGWARDPIRAAGGRRHYNAWRRDMAEWRRGQIVRVVHESGINMFARGTAAALARRFDVHRSTIGRDLDAIFALARTDDRCPVCHARALTDDAADTIAENLEDLRERLEAQRFARLVIAMREARDS